MNERYLFRGKEKITGKWLYGNMHKYTRDDNKHQEFCILNEDCHNWLLGFSPKYVDPATVGQCTGLKDKNGKLIFEGDILQLNGNPTDLTQICFGEFKVYDHETEAAVDFAVGWYMKVIPTDGLSRCEPFCYDCPLSNFWIKDMDAEIIGNIHEK